MLEDANENISPLRRLPVGNNSDESGAAANDTDSVASTVLVNFTLPSPVQTTAAPTNSISAATVEALLRILPNSTEGSVTTSTETTFSTAVFNTTQPAGDLSQIRDHDAVFVTSAELLLPLAFFGVSVARVGLSARLDAVAAAGRAVAQAAIGKDMSLTMA